MSTKEVIRNLRGLINEKAARQLQLKAELHKRHGDLTPPQMRESRVLRIHITACLNKLHCIKGTDQEEKFHQVKPDDEPEYWDYYGWLCDNSDELLDEPIVTICEKRSLWTPDEERQMKKRLIKEVYYQNQLELGKVTWIQKLLHAIGNACKG